MEAKDIDPETWKPKFKSEYSMGQFDFIRYNEWLKFVEQYFGSVTSSDIPFLEDMQKLFSGLTILLFCWKPLISDPKIRTKFKEMIKEAKAKKRTWEENKRAGITPSNKFIFDFQDLLTNLYEELMGIKQIIGLGIMVKKVMTTSQKIRQGVRGDKNLDNLPEA